MENPLTPASELALIDRELAHLDARRLQLLGRRDWLLRLLNAQLAPPLSVGPPAQGWGPGPNRPPGPTGPAGPAGVPARETSAPGAQSVLLVLGAVLLAVAALAFTLVSWGSLGIGGRAAVLAVLTGTALAVPAVLLRRGLGSTAESVAAVGLLLTVLDVYALHEVALGGVPAAWYVAGASAALAALWAGYGATLRGLLLPLPFALAAAQWTLPGLALALHVGRTAGGWTLLAMAALNAALGLWGGPAAAVRPRVWPAVRILAGVLAALAALAAVGVALALAADAGSLPGRLSAGVLLAAVGGAFVVVAGRIRQEQLAPVLAGAGGLVWTLAAQVLLVPRGSAWAPALYVLVSLPLLAALRVSALARPVRYGLTGAGVVVAGLGGLIAFLSALPVLAAPAPLLGEVWTAASPRAELGGGRQAVAVALIAAAVALWLERASGRREARVVAVPLAWTALFAAPVAFAFPVAAVFAAQLVVVAAALVVALGLVRAPAAGVRIAAGACGAVGAASLSVAALDGRTTTFAVWAALGALCGAGAAYGRGPLASRVAAAVVATGYATGLLLALAALLELPARQWPLLVLLVPAAAAAPGPRAGTVRIPVEVAGAAAGGLALLLALAAGHTPSLALVLGLAGVVCAAAAVRADRRAVGWAAGALFLAATWVRLAASGVDAVEAYTLPVTVPALVVAWLRRRRDPAAPSWATYGPGLAATLVPSLIAVWADPHWTRPLLLGLGALAVTLAGARWRLQAPLVLGGVTLGLVALHELAPYVLQVVGALPRWLPPALAGALLLAVGATYEKRLRDARRLRSALGKLG
ncbi:SCO7613 C-terminal domain-containing membrane protein [Streptomyces sp. NPDC051555]|uniref:SCO7613 C-terminal domain-containing membrane protein n=1 Tax=Streptomyces sp. NPDC051555 TaxID=3365657 RepID=UPI00379C7DA7